MIQGLIKYSLTIFLIVLLSSCGETLDDDTLIRNAIKEMQTAIESKSPMALLSHVADDYSDSAGRNYTSLKGLMLGHFLRNRNKKISVYITAIETDIVGYVATATFNAGVTGGTGILPEKARIVQVETKWRKQDDEWLMTSATWN